MFWHKTQVYKKKFSSGPSKPDFGPVHICAQWPGLPLRLVQPLCTYVHGHICAQWPEKNKQSKWKTFLSDRGHVSCCILITPEWVYSVHIPAHTGWAKKTSKSKICIKFGVFIRFSWFFRHIIFTLVDVNSIIFKSIELTNQVNTINMWSMVKNRVNSVPSSSVNQENTSFKQKINISVKICSN